MITAQQLQEIFHAKADDAKALVDPLNAAMKEFGIDTPKRQAMFLAQCAHESGNFSRITENLNYRAETLLKVFPKYFKTLTEAQSFEKKPEKIANRVYGGRMGNGAEATGEGYKYRGRGLIQLTGKDNYTACGKDLKVDLHTKPDYLLTAEGAARSAAWFWGKNGLNKFADAGDITGCTKRINGGTIGLEDRKKHYELALKKLS